MTGTLKIREIAAHTGLSISTVSRVLAGKLNTSAKARAQVLAYARASGILAGISSGRILFNHLLVCAPPRAFDVRTDIFYYKVIQGIADALARQDVHISYCGLEENVSDVQLFLKKITAPNIDAGIIIGIDDPRIHELAADLGRPCVLINSQAKNMRLDAVSPDHQLIGEFSANYLMGQGHRDILTLMCLRRSTMELRLSGIKEAFTSKNRAFDESRLLVTTSGFGAEESREAMLAFLTAQYKETRPTAILAGGDYMAAGAMDALQACGLSVPGDLSMMSMDSFNQATIHELPLCSVHVPRDELGQEAVRLLQQRILCPEAPFCHSLLGGKLVVGKSVRRTGGQKPNAAVSTRNHGLYGD